MTVRVNHDDDLRHWAIMVWALGWCQKVPELNTDAVRKDCTGVVELFAAGLEGNFINRLRMLREQWEREWGDVFPPSVRIEMHWYPPTVQWIIPGAAEVRTAIRKVVGDDREISNIEWWMNIAESAAGVWILQTIFPFRGDLLLARAGADVALCTVADDLIANSPPVIWPGQVVPTFSRFRCS